VSSPRSPRQPQELPRPGAAELSPAIFFRCRICGGVAVVSENRDRPIRCTACGFTEPTTGRGPR